MTENIGMLMESGDMMEKNGGMIGMEKLNLNLI